MKGFKLPGGGTLNVQKGIKGPTLEDLVDSNQITSSQALRLSSEIRSGSLDSITKASRESTVNSSNWPIVDSSLSNFVIPKSKVRGVIASLKEGRALSGIPRKSIAAIDVAGGFIPNMASKGAGLQFYGGTQPIGAKIKQERIDAGIEKAIKERRNREAQIKKKEESETLDVYRGYSYTKQRFDDVPNPPKFLFDGLLKAKNREQFLKAAEDLLQDHALGKYSASYAKGSRAATVGENRGQVKLPAGQINHAGYIFKRPIRGEKKT